MSEEDATTHRRTFGPLDRGGIVTTLLAPLRLPERVFDALGEVFDALGELVESVRDLPAIRAELTRIRESTEPLSELVTTLDRINEGLATRLDAVLDVIKALEGERSHLNLTVVGLYGKVDALHEVLAPVDDRLATLKHTTTGLAGDVSAIREDVLGIKDDIQRVPGLRAERGTLERVRDKFTGGDETPAHGGPEAHGP
jgi:chromosome segregation ATPase